MTRRYRFQALDANQQLVHGQMNATDPDELARLLRQHDLDLLLARRIPALNQRKLARRELIDFCFHLEQLLTAGISLLDALDDLAAGGSSKPLRHLYRGIADELRSGKSFSAALPGEITRSDASFAGIVRAGELSGRLAETLGRLGSSLRQAEALASATRKLLTYPLLAATLVLTACLFLMFFLVPQIRSFLGNAVTDLPWYTRLLFSLSTLLQEHWAILLATPPLLALAAIIAIRQHPAWHEAWHRLLLHIPLLGEIQRKLLVARLADLLAMLYASGVPLLEALELLPQSISNRAVARAVTQVHHLVEQGEALSGAFSRHDIFPGLLTRMLETGERTGRLDASLNNLAGIYEQEARATIGTLQALIEPALTLSIGILLGWMMLATLQPIYDIVEQVAR